MNIRNPFKKQLRSVIEWKEMEDKMYRGEDIFPLIIED